MAGGALYDTLGVGYTRTRRPDRRIEARIREALGDATTVVNVGAGTGSYEPADLRVLAVEPSLVMHGQRPPGSAPAVRAVAEALPLRDGAVDAAMAVLSDHHWPDRDAGLREMMRVARKRVVVLTWTLDMAAEAWITRDYLPQTLDLDRGSFDPEGMAERLGGARIEVVPIPWDCEDGFYHAFWRRPEAYLDPVVRSGISVFPRLGEAIVEPAIQRLAADLGSGEWEHRNAAIMALEEMDLGYRLVVAERK
jgi:SAM-dependent methyltransferase